MRKDARALPESVRTLAVNSSEGQFEVVEVGPTNYVPCVRRSSLSQTRTSMYNSPYFSVFNSLRRNFHTSGFPVQST